MESNEQQARRPGGIGTVRRQAVNTTQLIEKNLMAEGQQMPIVFTPAIEGVDLAAWVRDNREEIERALTENIPRGIVLADAAYGTESDFRDWLRSQELDYVLGVRISTSVWWGRHQPAQAPPRSTRGRPRTRVQRDAKHQPISVLEVARALPPKMWRNITWRQGSCKPLSSRFARVRMRAANQNRVRDEEWLVRSAKPLEGGHTMIKVVGVSEFVQDVEATFFTDLDAVCAGLGVG